MARSSAPLRAHRASSQDEDQQGPSPPTSPQDSGKGSVSASGSDADPAADDEEDSDEHDEPEHESGIHRDLQNISFGALAQAQAELDFTHSKNSHVHTNHERQRGTDAEKINNLRERLAELKKLKGSSERKTKPEEAADDSVKSTAGHHARSSKHAPAEQSSRRAVTRKRSVIDVAQNPFHSRDPRFSAALSSHQPSSETTKRNYAFLKSYRDAELSDLKDAMATVKSRKFKRKSKTLTADEENAVQQLRRQINSIENRMKSEAEKDRLKEVASRHKKEERELIKQGKKPFYLKQSELKERALKDKFQDMKAKEREKAVERRRKKLSHRERRAMPNQRRTVNTS